MDDSNAERASFLEWLRQPGSLVALSALLLSTCGLWIAVYETSLIRKQQRASVWPHVEVTPSISEDGLALRVRNTGIGPARIEAAALTWQGEEVSSWSALVRKVRPDVGDVPRYHSIITGRVIPPGDAADSIFVVDSNDGPAARDLATELGQQILRGGVEVELCYCSVYDECWTSRLQDVLRRAQNVAPPSQDRPVNGCRDFSRSQI